MTKILTSIKGDKVIWAVVLLLTLFSILAVYSSTGTLAYRFKTGKYRVLHHEALRHSPVRHFTDVPVAPG